MAAALRANEENVMKTVIAIHAGQPGSIGGGKKMHRENYEMDKDRIRALADQLTDLVEELDEIKEDLQDIEARLDESADIEEDAADESRTDAMQDICAAVESAYQELNEALDGLADFCE